MNGLDLSRAFFEAHGEPMLRDEFPDLLPYLAAGLFGSGSECFGYDDEVSRDHDFEPGFCLFLPDEETVDRRAAFRLERAYAKLPKEFAGVRRAVLQPVGGARHGVFRTDEFFRERVGTPDGTLSLPEWLALPEQALAEATNGVLFFDNYGAVSAIREKLSYFPEDVRLKKLAGSLLLMGQSGQYNYRRCVAHGETGAAQLAAGEFVRNTLSAIFLLNKTYQPYYKWVFRALRDLPVLADTEEALVTLLSSGSGAEEAARNADLIEQLAAAVLTEVHRQSLSDATCEDLEKHAYSVNDHIADGNLRNLHVLAAV